MSHECHVGISTVHSEDEPIPYFIENTSFCSLSMEPIELYLSFACTSQTFSSRDTSHFLVGIDPSRSLY